MQDLCLLLFSVIPYSLTFFLLCAKSNFPRSLLISWLKTLNPSIILHGLIISRILEASNIRLEGIPSVSVIQCYNSKVFISMGYVCANNTWVPKTENGVVYAPLFPKIRPLCSYNDGPSSVTLIILNHISYLEAKLDSLNDLLLASHFQIEKI